MGMKKGDLKDKSRQGEPRKHSSLSLQAAGLGFMEDTARHETVPPVSLRSIWAN